MFRLALIALASVLGAQAAQAPVPSSAVGIFEGHSDVGDVRRPSSAEYNPNTETYVVSGSGENMWAATDAFQFVWKQVSAEDLSLGADIAILGASTEGHRKAVLMIRQSLDADSAYVDAALHGEGLTSLQFRDHKGAITREVESNVSGPARLRIEKLGANFYLWIGGKDQPLEFAGGSARVPMQAPFYVGIGVCAHQKDVVEKAEFTNLELKTTVPHTHVRYSTVETAILSGDARSGFVSPQHLTSPGWSADGHALTYELNGNVEQTPFTPLRTAVPVGAPVAQVQGEGNQAAADAQPEPVKSDDFNNLPPHLSPDGRYLLFLSYAKDMTSLPENSEVSLRLMTVANKSVKTLATFTGGPGSLGAHPWSPDGRRIVFISYQTME
ncbi:MAG: hypothetical protein WA324_06550 [Bryobacteraceae bacterium]